MATVSSTEFTSAFVTVPNAKLIPANQHGRLRRAYASYTLPGESTDGDLIQMFKLPRGATIVYARFNAPNDGTAGIYDCGWDGGTNGLETADLNGIFSVLDTGAGAVDTLMVATIAGYNRKMADEVIIRLDTTETTIASVGDVLELEVWYVVD